MSQPHTAFSGEPAQRRRRLRVRGIVQGVGFRPFVYGLAHRLGLTGFVGNDSNGVFIEIEGPAPDLDAFEHTLATQAPPLAHVEELSVVEVEPRGEAAFVIVASQERAGARTLISPDLFTCADCLRELFDPADRRYLYPFINCTNCGPRFTIIKDIPYDRPRTTMSEFQMCDACAREYHDPADRRYHAQPIACPDCGPHVWLEWPDGREGPAASAEVLAAARQALAGGAILAVKGLGGFHLACDATSATAVQELRRRKGRVGKPFAVMVRDLDVARAIARVSAGEAARLQSPQRPIVLLQKIASALTDPVAPGNDSVGVMLPYTPLHYLLVGETPLVMTSGNFTDEPIVTDNATARARLAPLVDGFLLHDRGIHVPCDDSVMRVFAGADLPIRRSRGFAPFPVRLAVAMPPVLAVGGELKSTVCITTGEYALLSQHIGDMENLETQEAFSRIAGHLQAIFRAEPERIVCDMHPGYLSRRWAEQAATERGIPLVEVQHHHAHVAALMAEHGLDGSRPVLGFSFDGTGYGTDGAIWGGELLVADYDHFRRAAHLRYLPLPGGDGAIKHPYRCALAHLWMAGIAWDEDLAPVVAAPAWERKVLERQLERGLSCVPCSSMGRLFDAVASLIGIRQSVSYEAQAAIEMEALLPHPDDALKDDLHRFSHEEEGSDAYRFDVTDLPQPDQGAEIDPRPLMHAIVADLRHHVAVPAIAARFHRAVARLVVDLSISLRGESGLDTIALTGGVFQNVRLLALTLQACQSQGFTVLTHHVVPPNDGGLALGQAVIGGRAQVPKREYGEAATM